MKQALWQADHGLVGQIFLWGDPNPIHERTISWLHTQVRYQLQDYEVNSGGSTTTDIARTRLPEASTREVNLQKEPDDCYLDSSRNVTTTVEVAWGNESLAQLLAEVNQWAESGRNAIGLKLWYSADVGPSFVVLLQARHSAEVQVWKYGQNPEQLLSPDLERCTAVAVKERSGPAAIVPGAWFTHFGVTEQTFDVPPPAVVWSLSSIEALVEEAIAYQAEDEATGSERQRIVAARNADELKRAIRLTQVRISDFRLAEGISEELRQRLLSKQEEMLAIYLEWAGEA